MKSAKVYRSFEEFERSELRGPTNFHATIDELFDEMFQDEFHMQTGDDESSLSEAKPRRRRKKSEASLAA